MVSVGSMNRCLLVVDVQNDFLPDGALAVPRGDQILPCIKILMTLPFDLLVASRDFHPPPHMSFASTWNKEVGARVQVQEYEQVLWPDHCIQGTHGSEISPEIEVNKF